MLTTKAIAHCLVLASLHHHVPVDALLVIMEVEGGYTGLESRNKNGTYDLGLMQINTCWLPQLAHLWALPPQTVHQRLRDHDCLNINVAAYILNRKIQEGKGDIIQGIARYHSANPQYGKRYLLKIKRAYLRQQQARKRS